MTRTRPRLFGYARQLAAHPKMLALARYLSVLRQSEGTVCQGATRTEHRPRDRCGP